MRRPFIILLAVCVAVLACGGYFYYEHKKAEQSAWAALVSPSNAPDSPPAAKSNSSSSSSTSFRSESLVYDLPSNATSVIFADLAALRKSSFAGELAALSPQSQEDPQYRAFVRATGFDYSRDLDQVALAIWPQNAPTSTLGIARGKFDQAKIEKYALQNGRAVKHGKWKIYEVPEENSNRRIRFVFLAPNEMALADGPAALSEVLGSSGRGRLNPAIAARVRNSADAPIFGYATFTPAKNLADAISVNAQRSAQLANLLKSVRDISLIGRPDGSNLNVGAEADCDSTSHAFQLETVLKGLLLVGRAALADPKTQQQVGPQWPALDALLKSADISHAGSAIRLRVQVTPQILREALASPAGSSAK